ncbi:MAG: hypothetical protein WDN28_19465 [Chthoniobacter sp.]
MKSLFLLAAATAPMLLSACVADHEVYYRRHHPYRSYARGVVVAPAPVGIVYYNDSRGRYYWRHHRRVYVRYY